MIYHETPSGTLHQGEVLDILRTLPDESVNCCVTSPPYWGLRDYGTAEWEGGDAECEHIQSENKHGGERADRNQEGYKKQYKNICSKCGAFRKDKQLGLERTPEEYVARMVEIFREVRRVLRKDGTLWLNLGDSYNSHSCGNGNVGGIEGNRKNKKDNTANTHRGNVGLKDKDLVGIPWRVAFALQADGWYLRQDIIWHKPNPMPESVTDRCTKSHEYVFLMSKSAKYYYDHEAIKEPSTTFENRPPGVERNRLYDYNSKENQYPEAYLKNIKGDKSGRGVIRTTEGLNLKTQDEKTSATRNRRSVWTVTTKPFREAHFATYPRDLIRPMIQAGCPGQVCVKCGKPRERIMEYTGNKLNRAGKISDPIPNGCKTARHNNVSESSALLSGVVKEYKTTGHTDCGCNAGFEPGIVLDPFMGSGTTAIEAIYQGKRYIGIDLNQDYCAMAAKRIEVELDQQVIDL